jgi:hypothetical protein
MNTRNWISEFGLGYRVPVEVTTLVAKGLLEDCSWVNSTSPNFVHCGMELWVEHPDAHQRQRWLDCEVETSRYFVQVFPDNDGLREHVTLYEGGSIIMALAAMGFTPDEWMDKSPEPKVDVLREQGAIAQLENAMLDLEQLNDTQEYVERVFSVVNQLRILSIKYKAAAIQAIQNEKDK